MRAADCEGMRANYTKKKKKKKKEQRPGSATKLRHERT